MNNMDEKEIQVIESQWEIRNQFYAENDRVVKRHYQYFCAFGASILFSCFGFYFAQSGFLLPQFERSDVGFSIDKEQGSWFGK